MPGDRIRDAAQAHARARSGARAVLAVALAAAAGCAPPPATPPPDQRPPAAEPAEAPVPARPPAGRTVQVGPGAEGVVADPVTGLVAVAVRDPARLVLLDAAGGAVRAEVLLPGPLRHLQLAAPSGPVLVPVEATDQLLRVALPDGRILGAAATGEFPHDATAARNGLVYVADEGGGSVTVLDGDRTVRRYAEPSQPGGVAAAGNLVGMIDVRESTLTVYDAAAGVAVGTVSAGDGPTHLVADQRDDLIVTDTRGDAVLAFELTPQPRLRWTLPLPGRPYGIAYDPIRDRLWVTLTDRNELVGLDLGGSGPPTEFARLPTIRQPNTVAVDPRTGRVFVAGAVEGDLELVDP